MIIVNITSPEPIDRLEKSSTNMENQWRQARGINWEQKV